LFVFQKGHGTATYLSSKAAIQESFRRAGKVLSFCRTPSALAGITFGSEILQNKKHCRFPIGQMHLTLVIYR